MIKNKIINIIALVVPVTTLLFIMWGPQPSAKTEYTGNKTQAYPDARLSTMPIQPIPQKTNLNPNLVALGKRLFKDPRLSEKNISCNNCHNIDLAGIDGLKVSIDVRGGKDIMNTPTIFNASLNPLQTWFGHDQTLEEQFDGVIANVKHMHGNWSNIIERLRKDKNYINSFNEIFNDGITHENIKQAMSSFEQTLITPDSAFDDYLRGNVNAISRDQKRGFALFQEYGCISCHQGINVGGNLHARLGSFTNPFENDDIESIKGRFNLGRFNITNNEIDKNVFRVPSLRNVEMTAPYFHTGSVTNLEDAVKFMAKYQTGREIGDIDANLIADFLRSLSGKYQGQVLTPQYDEMSTL